MVNKTNWVFIVTDVVEDTVKEEVSPEKSVREPMSTMHFY